MTRSSDDTCYLSCGWFDTKTNTIIDPKLTAINLRDGMVRWEVPTWNEAGGIALDGDVLYFVAMDGHLGAYGKQKGNLLWDVNLDTYKGHRASYGSVIKEKNVLIVKNSFPQAYATQDVARTFFLDSKNGKLLAEANQGHLIDGHFITYSDKGIISYDLNESPLQSKGMSLPETAIPLEAEDSSGMIIAVYDPQDFRHGWNLMTLDGTVFGGPLENGFIPMHISNDTAYIRDRTRRHLTSVDIKRGKILWTVATEQMQHASASNTIVATISDKGILRCQSVIDGRLLWTYKCGSAFSAFVQCENNSVFLTVNGKLLYFEEQ